MVERARLELGDQLQEVSGAAGVQLLVARLGGRHVVDRGEVEGVVDLAAVLGDPLFADSHHRLQQIAADELQLLAARPMLRCRLKTLA